MQNSKEQVNCLFIADILGKPGRTIVSEKLPSLRKEYDIDVCVANCENASGGKGITIAVADTLYSSGVDVLTSGNHVWFHKEIIPYLDRQPYLLRPANYPPGASGSGFGVFPLGHGLSIGVLNLQGRVYMTELDCPFRAASEAVETLRQSTPIIVVDFHAEATSEKVAMGWFLDGKVSAVFGTHTHVQTADERILPKGTAYITDVGMTGPHDSVIGIETHIVLDRFLTQLPARFEPATDNVKLCGIIVTIDAHSGRALDLQRLILDHHNKEDM